MLTVNKLVIAFLLTTASVVAGTTLGDDVAIRVLWNHGIRDDAAQCDATELLDIQNSFGLAVSNVRSQPEVACGDYCKGMENCWIMHECNSAVSQTPIADKAPVLSEYELAIGPEMNEASLSGFTSTMRETCQADYEAIRKDTQALIASRVLSSRCAKFLRKKMSLSCVILPSFATDA